MLSWYNHLDGAAQPPGPGHARAVVGRGGGGAAQVVGQRRHHQRLRAGRRDGGEGDRPALVAGLHPQYNPNIDPKDTSVSKCIVRTCAVPVEALLPAEVDCTPMPIMPHALAISPTTGIAK